jgi:ADP-heptose:LPS heptosyltransferase
MPGLVEPPRRIQLCRPQNQFGDLLLNVPAIRAIREAWPRAHVTLIVGRQNAAAVLGQPWADEIRVVDTRSFFSVVGAAWPPRPRPDLAVYFTTVSYSKSGALLVRIGRARERVGFDPVRYTRRDRAGLTRVVRFPDGQPHQSEVSLALARAAGATGPVPPPPYYMPDPTFLSRAPSGVAYLHPGAGKLKNRWRAEGFAAVAAELLRRGLEVWLIEGPLDSGTTGAVLEQLGRPLPVVRGETIPMLAARFARAAIHIGNDTGPLHLAGAVGCPTVGLYGWSDPAQWKPVGACVRTVRAPDHSLDSIAASDVLDAALPLLSEGSCAQN